MKTRYLARHHKMMLLPLLTLLLVLLPSSWCQNSIFREFPHPCTTSDTESCNLYGSIYECCKFEDGTGLEVSKCMTKEQRGGL